MKRVTFTADETIIQKARQHARDRGTTLVAAFRIWLATYASPERKGEPVGGHESVRRYREAMKRLGHIRVSRKFTREELNSRD